MRSSRSHLLRLATVAVAVGVMLPVASAGAATRYAANYRFASSAGAAPCTDAARPCLLTVALGAATNGDEVVLSPGNFRKPGISFETFSQSPYDNPVVVPDGVTMRGAGPSATPPTIHVSPNAQAEAGVQLGLRSVLRDVNVVGNGSAPITYTVSLGSSSLVDRVVARTINHDDALQIGFSIADGSTVRNSVSYATGEADAGRVVAMSSSSPNATATVRNSTAISLGSRGEGISSGTSSGVSVLNVSNTIARGQSSDFRVRAGITGGRATLNIDHSNWIAQDVSAAAGATATLVQTGPNQNAATAAEPIFFDAAAGDFRQMPGSPTIDAGVVDVNNGPLDLGGQARHIGLTTDIGADELDPAAPPTPAPTPTPAPAPTPTPEPTPTPATTPTPTPAATALPLAEPTLDRTPPKLTALKLGVNVTRRKGTAITFSLSEPAKVRLAFGQPTSGRIAATGKCVKLTAKNRANRRCALANVRGTLTVDGKAGANRLSFKGRLGSKQQLKLGRYTLTAAPTDAAGNAGAAASRRFRLVR